MHPILIFEPYCWGSEHASFNAALLATMQLSFANSSLHFLGERQHLAQVEMVLREKKYQYLSERIRFHEIRIYRRNAPIWKRWYNELRLHYEIARHAEKERANLVLLSSITNTGLFVLKAVVNASIFRGRLLVIPHSNLLSLEKKARPWPWDLKKVLIGRIPPNIKLLALGPSVYENVMRILPNQQKAWISIDLPYLFPRDQRPVSLHHTAGGKIVFGFFGAANSGKRFDLFCGLSEVIGAKYPEGEFLLVGWHWGITEQSGVGKYVRGISDVPLSTEEFAARAKRVTYAVCLLAENHSRLTPSATFLDALSYGKPGIYLRNELFEHYFNRMGDIGYLCDSYEDVVRTATSILRDFPKERYQQQVENILRERHIFSPKFLAPRFRQIFDSLDI
jgi:hypothetical protein